jgi:hypothetical protein
MEAAKFLKHDDASRITPDDVRRFKDHRIAEGRSLKTVKDSDIAALKSALGWAVNNGSLKDNHAVWPQGHCAEESADERAGLHAPRGNEAAAAREAFQA